MFSQFKRFSGLPASIFIDFGTQNGCPDIIFLIIFWDRVFASIFDDFCRKNEKTQKFTQKPSGTPQIPFRGLEGTVGVRHLGSKAFLGVDQG